MVIEVLLNGSSSMLHKGTKDSAQYFWTEWGLGLHLDPCWVIYWSEASRFSAICMLKLKGLMKSDTQARERRAWWSCSCVTSQTNMSYWQVLGSKNTALGHHQTGTTRGSSQYMLTLFIYSLCRTIVTYKLTNWPKHKTNLHIFTCLFSDNSLCWCDTELTLKAWKNIQEQSWNYWEQSRRCHIYYIVQSSTEFMWWKTREVTYKKGRVLLFLFTKITADKIHISRALDTRQT